MVPRLLMYTLETPERLWKEGGMEPGGEGSEDNLPHPLSNAYDTIRDVDKVRSKREPRIKCSVRGMLSSRHGVRPPSSSCARPE